MATMSNKIQHVNVGRIHWFKNENASRANPFTGETKKDKDLFTSLMTSECWSIGMGSLCEIYPLNDADKQLALAELEQEYKELGSWDIPKSMKVGKSDLIRAWELQHMQNGKIRTPDFGANTCYRRHVAHLFATAAKLGADQPMWQEFCCIEVKFDNELDKIIQNVTENCKGFGQQQLDIQGMVKAATLLMKEAAAVPMDLPDTKIRDILRISDGTKQKVCELARFAIQHASVAAGIESGQFDLKAADKELLRKLRDSNATEAEVVDYLKGSGTLERSRPTAQPDMLKIRDGNPVKLVAWEAGLFATNTHIKLAKLAKVADKLNAAIMPILDEAGISLDL